MDFDAKLQQAVFLCQSGQFRKAEQICQQILRDFPRHADALHMLGVIAHQVGDYSIATSLITQAIEIDSNQSSFFYNLGNVLQEQGRLGESIDAYQQAIRIQPDYANAHKNLGIILLLKGNLFQGWKEYGWRWKCDDFISKNRDFPQSSWDGSNLNGKSILVWAEQGIGDEIMFTSILPTLSQMTEKIIIECNLRLVPLFQRSFPQIQFFSRQNPPHLHLLDKISIIKSR